GRSERNSRHFRRAPEADPPHGTESPADIDAMVFSLDQSLTEFIPITAGDMKRRAKRNADLPAMRVAGQLEVNSCAWLHLFRDIRIVREQNARQIGWDVGKSLYRIDDAFPQIAYTSDGESLAVALDKHGAVFNQADRRFVGQRAADPVRIQNVVVIAQHTDDA